MHWRQSDVSQICETCQNLEFKISPTRVYGIQTAWGITSYPPPKGWRRRLEEKWRAEQWAKRRQPINSIADQRTNSVADDYDWNEWL